MDGGCKHKGREGKAMRNGWVFTGFYEVTSVSFILAPLVILHLVVDVSFVIYCNLVVCNSILPLF